MVQRSSSILVRPRSQPRYRLRLNARSKTFGRKDYANVRHALWNIQEITRPVTLDARFARQWLPTPEGQEQPIDNERRHCDYRATERVQTQ